MRIFPDETDFISLFCSEPTQLDRNVPFFYNQSTFTFENETDSFIVKLSPSYCVFELTVKDKTTGRPLTSLSLQNLEKLEIQEDSKKFSKIIITKKHYEEELLTTIEITFRPQFDLIIKDHNS